jgi:hypothetical protein
MKWYWWVLMVVFVVLGIFTLVPVPASKLNMLGYYSHCTFTPISTVICWVIAGVCYWLGLRAAKKTP